MDALRVEHYIGRATDFLDGMRSIQLKDGLLSSSALLAIHSAISYSDALRSGLGDDELSSDDHRRAMAKLERLIPKQVIDRSGLSQLQGLLSDKSQVAYGRRKMTPRDLKALATRAERFARWANEVGRQLKIEGWRDGEQ
jgi:hypothetical protein